MAFTINRVTLLGRCTQDPELKYIADGTAVCTVNVATDRRYKEGDEWKSKPEFTRCTFWRKPAEIVAQHLSKGFYVYIEGRLQTRQWEDKDGNTRYATDVQVNDFVIPREPRGSSAQASGSDKTDDTGKSSNPGGKDVPQGSEEISGEDMPF
ncbi:single-stranded DNA-binding protein [Patescibacteria group bacterium]|nr:single-stranded DNA-binding protein [Patescibacteria group bacterium]